MRIEIEWAAQEKREPNQWTKQEPETKTFWMIHTSYSAIDVIAKSPQSHTTNKHISRYFSSHLLLHFEDIQFFPAPHQNRLEKNEERKKQRPKDKHETRKYWNLPFGPHKHKCSSARARAEKRQELSFEKCQCTELYLFHLALFPVVYSLNEKLKWKQENGDLDGNQFTFEHLFLFVLASHFRMNDDKNVHKNTQRGREWARDTGERRKRAMSATKWKAWIDKWIFSFRAHIKHFHFSGV